MAFEVPGEASYSRDTGYTGRGGDWTYHYDTISDARSYAEGIRSGDLDPFLGETWNRIEIIRSRNADGTFARGWDVHVSITRPAPGEDY